MISLPSPLAACAWAHRLEVAVAAVRSAGAALIMLRGTIDGDEREGGQLKTSTDLAAEGWVLGFLRGTFGDDRFLAEEDFEAQGRPWSSAPRYWTVDALDGTRSYVEGFDGFSVQIAFVDEGSPRLGVICEPVTGSVYVAASGAGAWRLSGDRWSRLDGMHPRSLEPGLRFADSTPPTGAAGALYAKHGGRLVECGGVGSKICRLVEDAADVYVKRFQVKLWDVAPGAVLLRETGADLVSWDGSPFEFAGSRTHYDGVIAASSSLLPVLVSELIGS